MYSLSQYGNMLTDPGRMVPYADALKGTIRPGAVVLDIGTGTGIFALWACGFGAKHVYAVEPDDVIHVAKEIARANGLGERITFFQEASTNLNLPERADVIVSDIRGALPLFGKHLPNIVDARARLLAPSGELIPRRDHLWAAPVEAPDFYAQCLKPWVDDRYGFKMQVAERLALNSWQTNRSVSRAQLMSPPGCWAVLDYTTLTEADVAASFKLTIERAGTGHGLSVWFDTVLSENIGFSNAPGTSVATYGGQNFFPWLAPVDLVPGDEVELKLRADLVGDDYIWCWETKVRSQSDRTMVKAQFVQSTFFGEFLTPERLHRQARDYIPKLTPAGLEANFILQRMGEGIVLKKIAEELTKTSPEDSVTIKEALTRVGRLAKLYCQ